MLSDIQIVTEEQDGGVVVRIGAKSLFKQDANDVNRVVDRLLIAGKRFVIVNLQGLDFVHKDLAVGLANMSKQKPQGVYMATAGFQNRVQGHLAGTLLEGQLETFGTLDEALNEFRRRQTAVAPAQ